LQNKCIKLLVFIYEYIKKFKCHVIMQNVLNVTENQNPRHLPPPAAILTIEPGAGLTAPLALIARGREICKNK